MTLQMAIKDNIAEVEKRLTRIEREQLPFATSLALNRTAANQMLTERRNMAAQMVGPVKWTLGSLRFSKSTKYNLAASVYVLDRAVDYLKYTVRTRRKAPRNETLMVPVGLPRLQGKGRVLNKKLARSYRGQLLAKPDHFEGQVRTTRGIFQRLPQQGIRLVVLYISQADYQKTWRFYENVSKGAAREFPGQFRLALGYALGTSRQAQGVRR